ncbi:hypothetical protein [Nocardia asteroides]|uniref:hypothetical protein n=1 Tax=Nocardia asteroides TaxID=1824 RepID=UPI001E444934|nr:hypothetical protein [Nocardia asteroides]UGT61616.1 hypothetical protein LTT61_31665 [Nocardia asteroides]
MSAGVGWTELVVVEERLSAWLTERVGSRVRVQREHTGELRLDWVDGPTVPRMRDMLGDFGKHADVALPGTACARDLSELGRTVAVLLWLDRDPDRTELPEPEIVDRAGTEIGYPERAHPRWQRRARNLRSVIEAERDDLVAGVRLLLHRSAATGWDDTLAWLDDLEHRPPRHLQSVP